MDVARASIYLMESEVLQALQALKAASKDIEFNSSDSGDSMNALLHLQTSTSLFHNDPKLTTLSSLLSRLKSHLSSSLSRIANSISSELQSWIDRQLISSLSDSCSGGGDVDEERSGLLSAFESQLNQGFDPTFQDLLLKSNLFSAVQSILADTNSSKNLCYRAATITLSFVWFNKHVFVGDVLMGPTVGTLVSVSSVSSICALNGLIVSIRSPLMDELHAIGGIKRIVLMLKLPHIDDEEIIMVGTAFETVLEIGYCGRKEAVDTMIEEGLVERLVALERSERREFESWVARFSIEMEVGEGLRGREKRVVKMEVLMRLRKMMEDAVGATILGQVLWDLGEEGKGRRGLRRDGVVAGGVAGGVGDLGAGGEEKRI